MPTRPISSFAGLQGGEVRSVERLFTGAPEVSEAVYRLAQAAREHRTGSEEIRLSPALNGAQEFGWYRVRVRPVPRPNGRQAALWMIREVTHERERQENVFQELQHAIDYLDHAPAGFLSVDSTGSIVYLNATLASWLDYDLATGRIRRAEPRRHRAARRGVDDDVVLGRGRAACAPRPSISICAAATASSCRCASITASPSARTGGWAHPARSFSTAPPAAKSTKDSGPRRCASRASSTTRPSRSRRSIAPGRIVHANAPFSKLFGSLPRTGDTGDEGPSILDAFRERGAIEAGLKAAAENKGDIPPLELQTAGENGGSVRVWVTPVGDTGADGETAILYALDTTDFRKVEEQLAQSQKMNAVGQLAGGVAHDFNNVLQAIIGYSDLLLANHRPTDPSFQDIMQIKQNANRAAGLVRQLLAFSRRQTLRPEVLNLNDQLYDLSMLLKRLLGERVALDLSHGRDLWFVKADVNQFEQVVVNLAVNARDAMPDGGKLAIRTGERVCRRGSAAERERHAAGRLRGGRGVRHRHPA